jgi:hypothetical protein
LRFSFLLPDCVDLACHAAGDHRDRPQRPEKLIKRDFGRLPFAMVVMPILHRPLSLLSEGCVSCPFATHRTKTGCLATSHQKNGKKKILP